ncbi:MAG: hypothetical protein JRE40_10125 [Deltaproteobacteria bacterium]|nr:hypothetical protein [Deltaproteobacteria bacterium]
MGKKRLTVPEAKRIWEIRTGGRTTITIFKSTKEELDKLGRKNESYDELIKRLIKLARRGRR